MQNRLSEPITTTKQTADKNHKTIMNALLLPYNLSRQPDRKHVQLLVAPDARTGEYWYENLKYWLGDPASLYWFSDWETLPYDQYTPHPDLVAERLRVLAELPTRTHGIVIASAAAPRPLATAWRATPSSSASMTRATSAARTTSAAKANTPRAATSWTSTR